MLLIAQDSTHAVCWSVMFIGSDSRFNKEKGVFYQNVLRKRVRVIRDYIPIFIPHFYIAKLGYAGL